MSVIIFGLLPYQFLYQVSVCALGLRSHDRALKSEPQAHGHTFVERLRQGFPEARVVEFGEEA